MADTDSTDTQRPWLALRKATGLSQREVERRLGWHEKRGPLSLSERGLPPNAEQEAALRRLYGQLLTGDAP